MDVEAQEVRLRCLDLAAKGEVPGTMFNAENMVATAKVFERYVVGDKIFEQMNKGSARKA